jgi:multidrug efflux pump
VPLAIAVGASANSRHSIGTGVIGGMLAATVIAVFFIPMFYYVIESLSERLSGGRSDRPLSGHEDAPSAGGAPALAAPRARHEDA